MPAQVHRRWERDLRGKLHLIAQAAIQLRRTRPQSQAGTIYLPSRIHPVVTVLNAALRYSKPFWIGASTVTAAMIVFGTVNYGSKPRPQMPRLQQQASLAPVLSVNTNTNTKDMAQETVVYRAPEQRQNFQERWEQAQIFFSENESEAEAQVDESTSPAARVQTVRAKNSVASIFGKSEETGIGALAFAPPSGPATFSLASATSEPVGRVVTGSIGNAAKSPEARNPDKMDDVDQYLWEVYQRAPVKKDGSGDFTWKDPAAAKKMGKTMPNYVIGGMDPDFKEQLYHAGKAMDAAGVQWALLSAFRDDYRQSLAAGFKASMRNSLHGGSVRVGGYGHGRAVDVTSADDKPEGVWKWLDANGSKYGLHRPMPGNDPAHVQSKGDWRKLAQALKASRVQIADARAAKAKSKVVASATGR